MAYISLKDAQDFLGIENRVTGIDIKVKDVYQSDRIGESITKILGYPYWIQDWKARNRMITEVRVERGEVDVLSKIMKTRRIVRAGEVLRIETLAMGTASPVRR